MMCTSTFGISNMRSDRVVVEVALLRRCRPASVSLPWSAAVRPNAIAPWTCASMPERVDRGAAVDRAAVTACTRMRPLLDRDLGDLGDDAAERLVHREAARAARRRRRAPAGLLGGELERARVARLARRAARAGTRADPARRRARARRSCSPSRTRCACCRPSATTARGSASSASAATTRCAGMLVEVRRVGDAFDRSARRCRS